MIEPRDIIRRLKPHINRLLTAAEIGLEGRRFEAFRKIVLEELGKDGFERDVQELFHRTRGNEERGNGQERNGPDHQGTKGGAP